MSGVRSSWLAALSLALGPLWLPVRFGITQVDSPRTALFGAPLPWRSPSIVFSGHTDVYWGPLLIDAAFWSLAAFALIHLWRRRASRKRVVNVGAGLAVALLGLTGALPMAAMFVLGWTSDFWYGPFAITFVSLGWS